MKKTLLALAVASVLSGAAIAQSSVTLYGNVDMTLANVKSYDRDASTKALKLNRDGKATVLDSKAVLDNGFDSATRWGIKGSEDLGGGLSAIFKLETQVNGDTGTGDGGFARENTVGLAGDFGSVTLGRQLSPEDDAQWDIGRGFNVGNWGLLDKFVNNSIKWTSTNFSGLTLRAMYALGEEAGNRSYGEFMGLSAVYSNGPIWAGVGYDTQKASTTSSTANNVTTTSNTGGTNKTATAAVGYNFGPATVKLGYTADKNGADVGNDEQVKRTTVNLGVSADISSKLGVAAEIGNIRNAEFVQGLKATAFAMNAGYSLSTRTTVYGGYKMYKIKDADGTESKFGVGLKHVF